MYIPKLYRAFYLKVEVIEDQLRGGEHWQNEYTLYAKCRFVLDRNGSKKIVQVKPFDELTVHYDHIKEAIDFYNDIDGDDFDWCSKKPSWDEHLEEDRKMELRILNAVKRNHSTPYKERMKQNERVKDFFNFF